MIKLVVCSECDEEFDILVTTTCPHCKTKFPDSDLKKIDLELQAEQKEKVSEQNYKNTKVKSSDLSKISPEGLALIQAQNRTTYAVRSLAITFVYAPVIFAICLIISVFAFQSGNEDYIFFSLLLTVIVLIIVLLSALESLSKSRIPREYEK
jgi:hypothetical protein